MECKNCNTSLTLESDYCHVCGGKVIRNRLTIKHLLGYFTETFLNYDNKFLQTFISLFTKPDDVIGSYINGTRKKYVNVISYFAIALTITGIEWYILNTFFPDLIDMSSVAAKGQEALANESVSFVQDYISIVLMLFVPVYALMSKLVFFTLKKYNYTEHLVIFMYIIAQISIFGALINLTGVIIGIPLGHLVYINGPFQLIFSAYCLKKLYNLSIKGLLLRTLLFLVIFLLFFILFSALVVVVNIVMHGGVDAFMEAQKSKIQTP
ncbi:DUF3667 domain-containing protein [Geojedonia litorea]|uniref:DUF3667 domain-containing protein n=1 Tax=Geojedonia litorea TaxID=1268269 RepID=A0ABV9MXQ0_9FLAO